MLLLPLVESEERRCGQRTGMSPILHVLGLHTVLGVVTDQEVACRRTRHVTVTAKNPGGGRSWSRNQTAARQEHPCRNGRALRTWPLSVVVTYRGRRR